MVSKNITTKNAITTFINLLDIELRRIEPTAAVFLDLAKAFDIVDHEPLLFNKLYSLGIRGIMLEIQKIISETEWNVSIC